DACRSIGVALTPCVIPESGKPSFEIAADEVEFGMGIHGEPGIWRGKLKTADALTSEMLDRLLPEAGLARGDRAAVLVNSLDATLLKSALDRWCAALEAAAPELNALDGRLGDGDLGATLQKCAANVREAAAGLPDDLAGIFKRCAGACANASGSSFGTLLAVAFLTASKPPGGAERMDRRATVQALDQAVAALSARGGAARGDKTMLDSLHAIARALDEAPDGVALRP